MYKEHAFQFKIFQFQVNFEYYNSFIINHDYIVLVIIYNITILHLYCICIKLL